VPVVVLMAAALVISLMLTGLLFIGAIILGAVLIVGAINLLHHLHKKAEEQRVQREADEHKAALERERQRIIASHPTAEEFVGNFAKAMLAAYPQAPNLPPQILKEFLSIANFFYDAGYLNPDDLSPIAEALLKSFLAFVRSFPRFPQAQLSAPVAELVDLAWITKPMIDPFRDPRLASNSRCLAVSRSFDYNCVALGQGKVPVYPQDFLHEYRMDKKALALSKAQIANYYLKGTYFNPLFQMLVPFGFTDSERFEHQLITAPSGQGKSTYLCNIIRADLKRVEKDEICLIIIDPKASLSKLAQYEEFAKGRSLDGKLIYVEPSSAHPLALNPFKIARHLDSEPQKNSAIDLLSYTLGSIFQTDPTEQQSTFLRFVFRLMFELPNPTLHTIVDFLSQKNYLKEQYQSAIRRMKDPYKNFLLNQIPEMRSDTRNGIINRLSRLLERSAVETMFCASECRFDMFNATIKPSVIVVDANIGVLEQEGMEIFGRLFLAMLLQTSRRRVNYNGPKPPIFCYVDEAQNFISQDIRTRNMLNEVRSQNIGMTFSPQRLTDVDLPQVRAALEDSKIRVRTTKGSASVQIGHEEATKRYTVHFDDFRYYHEGHPNSWAPQMSPLEFEDIKAQMRARYCAAPPREPTDFVESFDRP
jgi:hypothetical protein